MNAKTKKLQDYIESYWDNLLITDTAESKQSLGLPKPYYAPSTEVVEGFSFPYMFYWDSYFIAQGLFGTGRQADVGNIIENMFDLIRRFGFVPNSTSFSHLSRSQPPLLSSLVVQYIEHEDIQDAEWLTGAYKHLVEEYRTAWLGNAHPHIRAVHKGLSRYYDTNVIHVLAEAESGWDYTTRFEDSCLDYLPIDLNSLLYKFEQDLEWLARRLGRERDAVVFQKASKGRMATVTSLMWHQDDGFFYDYDYRHQRQGHIRSLAAYVAMFSGLASESQAKCLVDNLPLFETDHGLTTTAKEHRISADKQWASPNGWAPLHDVVVGGLIRYGYHEQAQSIAAKWIRTVAEDLERTGLIYEKYNVIDPSLEAGGAVYPDQHGFGWTNGVTYKFIKYLYS